MPGPSQRQADVLALMQRLYVAVPEASLRQEDRRKAIEVAAMLDEMARVVEGMGAGRERLTVVDAASGKGYLGLLAAPLVLERAGRAGAQVITIEREAQRAALVRQLVPALASPVTIEVRQGDVGDAACWPQAPDLVVALHACGPAADAIIDAVVASAARHLLLVPCCTGHLVATWQQAGQRADELGFPRQAAVRGRFRQAFVDAERTLRLESAGWQTEVVELCPPTVTPHNLLWRARRVAEPGRMAEARGRQARLLLSEPPDPLPAAWSAGDRR